ncbi:MAG: hypothetical protein ABEN55_05120, partial [Bradymonadaceae bacterium]
AYEDAGYGPRSVSMFEAHGTSTPVGDPTEFNSTWDVVSEDNGPKGSDEIAIGSVKSMIGHLKAGAGAASLIKAAYSLKNNTLPPTLNVENPHPDLNIDETPFRIQHEAADWETNGDVPRRAGVSAFGFGGTNYHVTLEEYDPDRVGSGHISPGGSTSTSSDSDPSGGAMADGGHPEVDLSSGLMAFGGETEDELAEAFEDAVDAVEAALAASWFSGPIKKTLNYHELSYS